MTNSHLGSDIFSDAVPSTRAGRRDEARETEAGSFHRSADRQSPGSPSESPAIWIHLRRSPAQSAWQHPPPPPPSSFWPAPRQRPPWGTRCNCSALMRTAISHCSYSCGCSGRGQGAVTRRNLVQGDRLLLGSQQGASSLGEEGVLRGP